MIEREAFRAIPSFGGTIASKEVYGKDNTRINIWAFIKVLKLRLLNLSKKNIILNSKRVSFKFEEVIDLELVLGLCLETIALESGFIKKTTSKKEK